MPASAAHRVAKLGDVSGDAADRSAAQGAQMSARGTRAHLFGIDRQQCDRSSGRRARPSREFQTAARRASSTSPYGAPRIGSSILLCSSGFAGRQSMSKKRAYGELGPFSRTSRHHRFAFGIRAHVIGHEVHDEPHAAGAERSRSASRKSLVAAELRIDRAVIADVVAVRTALARGEDRRAVAVGDAERCRDSRPFAGRRRTVHRRLSWMR